MEKFYRLEPESKLHNDYVEYITNEDAVRKAFGAIAVKYGIEATEYFPGTTMLAIVPTQKDRVNFASKLQKTVKSSGLVFFRAKSDIGKEWAAIAAEIKPQLKPRITRYVHEYISKARSRIFEVGGVVYCSIETDTEYTTPDSFVEMKASEFFKVIEDDKDRIEAEKVASND
jgi:hypothetical protein